MFRFAPLIQLRSLQRGLTRFPLPILAASVTTVSFILATDKGYEGDLAVKIGMLAGLCFVASLLAELLIEAARAHTIKRILANLGVLIGVATYAFFYLPKEIESANPPFWYGYCILLFCLHLGIALTPIRSTTDPGRIWHFNLNLFLRFIFSAINAAIIYAGLALALFSVDKLFHVGWYDTLYLDIWLLCAFTVHPILFLGGITRVQELDALKTFPVALHFSLRFVGLPLTSLYLLILYAYVAKMLLEWNWPNGWVALPIFILSVISLLAFVLSIPLASSERWAALIKRWLFPLLFPLSIVLILALQVRLDAYGMTINRYFGLALGIWLCGLSLSMLIRPRLHVAWIPGTLLAIALFSIYSGPLGAFAWSERSQVGRIHTLAAQLGIWQEGQLAPAPTEEPKDSETVKEFSSALRYVFRNFGYAPLENELAGYAQQSKSETPQNRGAHYLTEHVIQYLQLKDDLDRAKLYFRFEGSLLPTLDHRWKLDYNLFSYRRRMPAQVYTLGPDTLGFQLNTETDHLILSVNNSEITQIELRPWAEEVREAIRQPDYSPDTPPAREIAAQGWRFTFFLTSANFQADEERFQNAEFTVFLTPPKKEN